MTQSRLIIGRIRLVLQIRHYQDHEIVVKDQLVKILLRHQSEAKSVPDRSVDNMVLELLRRVHFSFSPKQIQTNFQTDPEQVLTGYHPNLIHLLEPDFITRIIEGIRFDYNVIIT